MEPENHTASGITGAEKTIDEAKKAFEDAAGIDMQVTKGVQPKPSRTRRPDPEYGLRL